MACFFREFLYNKDVMKRKLSIISRISLAVFTAYFSVVMCLGLVVGYFLGRFISRRIFYGRFKPLIFELKGVKIHLHHWLLGILWFFLLGIFASSLLENLFIAGLGGGIIFEDIWHDRKWWRVFGRTR